MFNCLEHFPVPCGRSESIGEEVEGQTHAVVGIVRDSLPVATQLVALSEAQNHMNPRGGAVNLG